MAVRRRKEIASWGNPNPIMKTSSRLLSIRVLFVLLLFPWSVVFAADAGGAGIVEGRVSNPGNGEFLERVRITVEGTTLEAFTDTSGFYRLTNVPAGAVRVRAFYTGLGSQTNQIGRAHV